MMNNIIEKAREFYLENGKLFNKKNKNELVEMFDKIVDMYIISYFDTKIIIEKSYFNDWLKLDLLKNNDEYTLLKDVKLNPAGFVEVEIINNKLTKTIREIYIKDLRKSKNTLKVEENDNFDNKKDLELELYEIKKENKNLREFIDSIQKDIEKLKEKELNEYDVIDKFNLNFYAGSLFFDILNFEFEDLKELYNLAVKIKIKD